MSSQLLPLINEVSPEERLPLFISKLRLCSELFDFSNPSSFIYAKEIKRQTLTEILQVVSTTETILSTPPIFLEIMNMISTNIFRPLPPRINSPDVPYDPDDDEPILELGWVHMQLIYELFLCCAESSCLNSELCKNIIDEKFITKFLQLFVSEDPRERDYLKNILHRLYGKFVSRRPFIRNQIRDILCSFQDTKQPNGISEFLDFLGSIISGFNVPLKAEHTTFFVRVLLPLYKNDFYRLYRFQLSYCVIHYLQKDSSLVNKVFEAMLKHWPKANASKEILFYEHALEVILNTYKTLNFRIKIQLEMFKRLSRGAASPHFVRNPISSVVRSIIL